MPSDDRSRALYARAVELLPGGVNSPVRAMRSIGRDPIFVAAGEGAELIDVDGNRYVDYVCSWGPLIAGHAHPRVIEAVTAAAASGTSFGAPTEAEVEIAAAIVERVPGAEMARMVSSGTEASMSAIRLARAATGREKLLKFAGAYHGHVDGLLADAGSGLATAGIPASPGVPAAQAATTVVVPWNDRAAVERALAEHEVAAVLAEPYPANMGLVPPAGAAGAQGGPAGVPDGPGAPGFLAFLREQADANGALLVFDEVISGFRVGRGGAQEREGVTPDLTVLGKVIGGGLPAAAYAGRRDLMERVAPAGDVYQAGTLSGNPLATAAGLATLELLDADAYARLDAISATLADGLREAAAHAGVPVHVTRTTGLLTLFFHDGPVSDYAGAKECDLEAYAAFCRAMLDRGVYLPPSQFEAWFPSLAHTDAQLQRTLAAAAEALSEMAS
ncbi:MAG TPA: glutamate-1-semialdehyde 2,1-aminomutase [Thermoleophilaceae bacterium]|nr:glutamate-1-semialdehyde 2,1-aminomutase [Thermoleophilaceae bacterium]